MEIKVIPARLQKHTVYLEEEIRIARRIEEMAEEAFGSDPGGAEILPLFANSAGASNCGVRSGDAGQLSSGSGSSITGVCKGIMETKLLKSHWNIASISQSFEVLVPDFLKVKELIPLFVKIAEELSGKMYQSSGTEFLCPVRKTRYWMQTVLWGNII